MLGVGGDVGYGGCEPIIEGMVQCTKRYCTILRLELMFMKHYAPNRCLYLKVAKLRTGVECRDVTPTKLQTQKIFKESTGGGGGGQDGCERRIKVFVKIKKKKIFFFFGGGGVGLGGGGGGGAG